MKKVHQLLASSSVNYKMLTISATHPVSVGSSYSILPESASVLRTLWLSNRGSLQQ